MSIQSLIEKNENPRTFPDRRGQVVLSAIINEHLVTGEPVGSKTVAQISADRFAVSSATVRNVMSELEDCGLLEQPHTSAGRVPTDKGYRFFVDHLLGVLQIREDDLQIINRHLGIGENEYAPDRLMEKTSQLLSALSNKIGIVVSPGLTQDRLRHIEFVNLSDRRILVILVSAPHTVHHRTIRLNENFKQEELDRTARYLNAEFGGKCLTEIRADILKLMHEEKSLFDKLLQTAMILCSQSIESEDETGAVFVDGTANILGTKDFDDFERLRELLKTIEEKSRLVRILNECILIDDKFGTNSGQVQVIIGSENANASMQNCALISAPYRIGENGAVGTLNVLGPTRIEYARMIAVVGYVAKLLEKLISTQKIHEV